MKKVGLLVASALVLAVSAAGCWSRHELDTLAVVMGAGLDRAEEPDRVRLTAQVAVPAELGTPGGGGTEGGGGGARAAALAVTTGRTVRDAAENLNRYLSRTAYWPHLQVLVIGEEAAREGIGPLLDFWNRQEQPPRFLWVLVAAGEAQDIFAAEDFLESISSVGIAKLLHEAGHSSVTRRSRLLEVTRELASPGISPVLARIAKVEQAQGKQRVRAAGAAAFRGDRLAGWLDGRQTRGLLWITGQAQSGTVVVKCPQAGEFVSLKVRRAGSKIIPEKQDSRIAVRIEIDAEADLGDQSCPLDLTTPARWRALERQLAEAIESEAAAALRPAQEEFLADIFGLGAAIRRRFPREWELLEDDWDREGFPLLPVTLQVTARLHRPGLILQPNGPR